MDRGALLQLWNDMAKEGNWVPSWPDSLANLSPQAAAWTPGPNCHSIWQEVSHVIFWRQATLKLMAGGASPTADEVEQHEFALPDTVDADSWAATIESLRRTHEDIVAAIVGNEADISRVSYHLIHDAYHLGRITQLRGMQGTPPTF